MGLPTAERKTTVDGFAHSCVLGYCGWVYPQSLAAGGLPRHLEPWNPLLMLLEQWKGRRLPLFLFSHPPTLLESWGNRSLAPRVLIAARSWLSFGAATLPWLDGAVAEGVAPQPNALPSRLS